MRNAYTLRPFWHLFYGGLRGVWDEIFCHCFTMELRVRFGWPLRRNYYWRRCAVRAVSSLKKFLFSLSILHCCARVSGYAAVCRCSDFATASGFRATAVAPFCFIALPQLSDLAPCKFLGTLPILFANEHAQGGRVVHQ